MSNQRASPASQLNLPFDSLSIGKERGKLYKNRDWLYQKYCEEDLTIVEISDLCKGYKSTIGYWLKKFEMRKTRLYKDKDWLKQKYIVEKLSAPKMGELCRVTSSTIRRWLEKFEIKRETRIYPKKDWLYQKYCKEGLSALKIGELCGVSTSKIFHLLKEFKIKTRINREGKGNLNPLYKDKDWLERKFINEKKSTKELGKICNVTYGVICWNLRKFKIEREKPIYWDYNWLQEKYIKEKLSATKIADSCGVCCYTIVHQLEKNGIETRGRTEAVFLSRKKRPTTPEIILDENTPDYVRYVGDGSLWLTLANGKSKNPDFKIMGQNKVIEVFGDYWHRKGMKYDDPKELISLYNQAGFQCLVIWEHEIRNNKDKVLKQINEFIQLDKGKEMLSDRMTFQYNLLVETELKQQEQRELYKNRDWLYQKYCEEALTITKIGELCGMSISTIQHWLKTFGIRKLYQDRDWLYQKYITEDLSSHKIGELCGVKQSQIGHWLKTFGIRRKTRVYHRDSRGCFC